MRLLCRLLLLSGLALALSAPAASATPVEVTHEENGYHCSYCYARVLDEVGTIIYSHIFGVESEYVECDMGSDLAIWENGSGYLIEQSVVGIDCDWEPCMLNEEEVRDWLFWFSEPTGEQLRASIRICLTPTGGGGEYMCTFGTDVYEVSTHRYELVADNAECGAWTEVNALWVIEDAPPTAWEPIEVSHL